MRTTTSTAAVLVLLVTLAPAALGRTMPDDQAVDVLVDGHSPTQLNATRYDVGEADGEDDAPPQAPDVTLKGLGSLSGTVTYSDQSKRPIFSYLGVPFAEPPVGDLRFKAPVPKQPWSVTLDASTPGNICLQLDTSAVLSRRVRAASSLTQSEDCLVLDVHTPQVNSSAKLPVLVFVHGGSFLTGWAGEKNPQGLLDHDMVLVSPQYRLGPLGFLNLQTDGAPGNAGLLDLVEALRWVRDHIEQFGGDPARVTLGGHSAGAAAVSLLSLSPLTRGLVHAVLPMSGSALAFWAYDRAPEQVAGDVAQFAGCGGADVAAEERATCLKKVPAKRLVRVYMLYTVRAVLGGRLVMSGSTPSLQKAGVIVLPDLPENILSSSDYTPVPYLTGITKHEGTFPLEVAERFYLLPNKLTNNTSYLRNDLIHVLLKVIGLDDPAAFVTDASLQAFFDHDMLGDFRGMRDGLIDMAGAFGFKSPCHHMALRVSEHGQQSTYLYAFNHNGALTQNSPLGIVHGADQPYIFPAGNTWVGDDLQIALTLRKLVANFVIYQNPTPGETSPVADTPMWAAYARDSEHYLELVWPPAHRQWFSPELTAARRDQFSEGGRPATDTTPPAPATSTSGGSPRTHQAGGDDTGGGSAGSSAPSAAVVAVLALIATLALHRDLV